MFNNLKKEEKIMNKRERVSEWSKKREREREKNQMNVIHNKLFQLGNN